MTLKKLKRTGMSAFLEFTERQIQVTVFNNFKITLLATDGSTKICLSLIRVNLRSSACHAVLIKKAGG